LIRHHALSSLVSVVVAVALMQTLTVDAPDKSWDSREGSAKLFSQQEDPVKKHLAGSSTASTVEKWQAQPKLRIAQTINKPKSSRPNGVRLHLVSMTTAFSAIADNGVVVGCNGAPGPTFASVANGNPTGPNCSTNIGPDSGSCSVSNTSGNQNQTQSCSTTGGTNYCSTGPGGTPINGAAGPSGCSTTGGTNTGSTPACSATTGKCSTDGTNNSICSTKTGQNQQCSSGSLATGKANAGAGQCSAFTNPNPGGGAAQNNSCSALGDGGQAAGQGNTCSTSGGQGQTCSVSNGTDFCSVASQTMNASCTVTQGGPAAACSTSGAAVGQGKCSVLGQNNADNPGTCGRLIPLPMARLNTSPNSMRAQLCSLSSNR